jgi:rhodanese-related sulfurtransferase
MSRAACLNFEPILNPLTTTRILPRIKRVIVYCASGGRSALSGKALKDMGYGQVFNVGGF